MAKSTSKFKYRERSADSVKKRAEQDSGAFDSIFKSGIDTFRPKAGENQIRFLPPTWEDPEHYGYDVYLHSYIGADSGSYLCLQKMQNKKCPICIAAKEAADAGEADEAKALKAKKSVAAWIIDRDEDNPTPSVYLMSWTMDRDISALCHNKRSGKVLMIDNPDNGYDVTIKRSGAGLKTRYFGMAIDRDPSTILDSQKEQDKLLEYVDENPIPSILLFRDAKYLESVVDGTAPKRDKDEEEDDAPRRGKGSRKREEPEEEEEDAAPPARRRKAEPEEDDDAPPPRRRKAEPEEDDAPPARRRRAEPEAEEDDDAPPPRRKRAEPEEDDEPPRRRRAEPEEESEDEPPPRRRRAEPEEESEDEPPPRRRRGAAEPEEDDDAPPPRRRRAEPEAEEDDTPPPRRRR